MLTQAALRAAAMQRISFSQWRKEAAVSIMAILEFTGAVVPCGGIWLSRMGK